MYQKADALNISKDIINVADEYNNSALYWAITNGKIEAAQFIIEMGANVNTATNELGKRFEGDTPLISASGYGYLSIVNEMIEHGAKIDVRRKDGAHAAFMAAQKGHLEILQLLVNEDPSVAHLKGFEGKTCLYAAALGGHLNIVKYLASLPDIDVNCEDEYGEVPILAAAVRGHLDVLKYLTSLPLINLNKQDIHGYTPLMHAVYENCTESVLFLLQNGADSSIKDNYGKNALYWALLKNNANVIDILEKFS